MRVFYLQSIESERNTSFIFDSDNKEFMLICFSCDIIKPQILDINMAAIVKR